MNIHLDTPLKQAIKTTKLHLFALESMGILCVKDLLLYFPRTYEWHNDTSSVADFHLDQINEITASVVSTSSSLSPRTRRWYYKATLKDENDTCFEAIWFAKPYQLSSIKEGSFRKFIGKVKYDFGKFSMQSPRIETINSSNDTRNIFPVYSQTEKISSSYLFGKIENLLDLSSEFDENLPGEIIKEEKLMKRSDAIRQIHAPDSKDLLEKARERLAFEEIFSIQIDALNRKIEFQQRALKFDISVKMDVDLVKSFFASLPYTPTNAQKIAIFEILKDMENNIPMSRLLEGDVGSGKTLVAATAALLAIYSGYQVVFMAPTEVLARQHFLKMQEYFQVFFKESSMKKTDEPLRAALFIGALKSKEKQEVLLDLLNNKIHCIIGTHAIIQDTVKFHKLGFVIIDEQHRFGVDQRKKLSEEFSPHVLNMTATPIPRTLALVAYGDQDISVLNEMPPGRQEIVTRVVTKKGRKEVTLFIDTEFEKGRQAYVICPLIEESKSEIMAEVKSVTKEYERLKNMFPHRKIGILHGKMKSEEKNTVMMDFKGKKIDMLVSTSVIEVGVDVPNSTIMIIEGAERFGLSQLHQFRGRVGRGKNQSYCFLFPSKESLSENSRLQALEKNSDGFKLAEIDLQLRGPGEVYGVRQSGIPDLKMARLTDHVFIVRVRQSAEKYLSKC